MDKEITKHLRLRRYLNGKISRCALHSPLEGHDSTHSHLTSAFFCQAVSPRDQWTSWKMWVWLPSQWLKRQL